MKRASVSRETAESPARNSYAVTPHDTNPIGEYEPKALYVGTGGTLVMELVGDTAPSTFLNVPSGTVLPLRPRVIRATGTTAAGLVALY